MASFNCILNTGRLDFNIFGLAIFEFGKNPVKIKSGIGRIGLGKIGLSLKGIPKITQNLHPHQYDVLVLG